MGGQKVFSLPVINPDVYGVVNIVQKCTVPTRSTEKTPAALFPGRRGGEDV